MINTEGKILVYFQVQLPTETIYHSNHNYFKKHFEKIWRVENHLKIRILESHLKLVFSLLIVLSMFLQMLISDICLQKQ